MKRSSPEVHPTRNLLEDWREGDARKLSTIMLYQSVGHNCNLLLNANPGPDGLVPEADFQRYVELGREIGRRFGTPLVSISGTGSVVRLDLPEPSRVEHVSIGEDIVNGERIRAYAVEAQIRDLSVYGCDG